MFKRIALMFAFALALFGCSSAYEQPAYSVSRAFEEFELRDYAPTIVAETAVPGDVESASDAGFRSLFDYISGNNAGAQEISMTAPVTTTPQKIAMTAPVTQQSRDGGIVMQFVMPKSFTLATLPKPMDPAVALRTTPARRFAAIRYSGTSSQSLYDEQLAKLRAAMAREKLEAIGEPVWARYDPPFTPWFLRRNEIMLELKGG